MAAPNIVNVATITGKTAYGALTTSAATMLNNAASSGKVLKVNSIIISNIDGTNSADVTVSYYTQDDIGGTPYRIAFTIAVPADASIELMAKSLYLEEDRSIGGSASANSDLEYLVSYEDIS
jgi:hypothetical protein